MNKVTAQLRYFRLQSFDRTAVVERRLRSLIAQSRLAGPAPSPHAQDRFFINSVPKAGTHLLRLALNGMPAIRDSGVFLSHLGHDLNQLGLIDSASTLTRIRNGYFVSGHMPWSQADAALLTSLGYRSLLLIRDPRDVLLSQIDHAVERPVNRFHQTLLRCPDRESQVRFMLAGGPLVDSPSHAPAFGKYLRSYCQWSDALVVRFEDLAGQRGGADSDTQQLTIRAIAEHLGVSLSQKQLNDTVFLMSSSETPTLRKGQVDRWRTEFTPAMQRMADDSLGGLIEELGYRW